jgi:hypothetical protein
LFFKTKHLYELARTKANLLEGAATDAFQAPVQGWVRGLYLSSDELVLALAKRRSVLFFSAKALEQRVRATRISSLYSTSDRACFAWLNQNPTPLGKVRICASREEEVRQLTWHPVIPNLMLALSSTGKTTLIDSAAKRTLYFAPPPQQNPLTSNLHPLPSSLLLVQLSADQ